MAGNQDVFDAPLLPERFAKAIVDAIASGAVKVEVFLDNKKKLKIRIIWD